VRCRCRRSLRRVIVHSLSTTSGRGTWRPRRAWRRVLEHRSQPEGRRRGGAAVARPVVARAAGRASAAATVAAAAAAELALAIAPAVPRPPIPLPVPLQRAQALALALLIGSLLVFNGLARTGSSGGVSSISNGGMLMPASRKRRRRRRARAAAAAVPVTLAARRARAAPTVKQASLLGHRPLSRPLRRPCCKPCRQRCRPCRRPCHQLCCRPCHRPCRSGRHRRRGCATGCVPQSRPEALGERERRRGVGDGLPLRGHSRATRLVPDGTRPVRRQAPAPRPRQRLRQRLLAAGPSAGPSRAASGRRGSGPSARRLGPTLDTRSQARRRRSSSTASVAHGQRCLWARLASNSCGDAPWRRTRRAARSQTEGARTRAAGAQSLPAPPARGACLLVPRG